MGSGKLVRALRHRGLGLRRGTVAVLARFRESTSQDASGTLAHRLLAHSRDRNDYRMFVGVPPANPTAWTEVARIDDLSVTLSNFQVIDLRAVTAYFVAYPSGTLVDYQSSNELSVPDWVKFLKNMRPADRERLTAADLTAGQSQVRVEFGKSTSEPNSRHHYSTTLTNASGNRVRVLKFAGYTKTGNEFYLNTITSQFFTANDFKGWYSQKGEWIEPGESVTDPNNYGSPNALWAYYCEAEGGKKFLTGGIID